MIDTDKTQTNDVLLSNGIVHDPINEKWLIPQVRFIYDDAEDEIVERPDEPLTFDSEFEAIQHMAEIVDVLC